MTSNPIYTACTYLTIYFGNKLPMFYIGSTSIHKIINKNYHGSVTSKEYHETWKSEIKQNPHLFKTKILKTFETRNEAYIFEEKLHRQFKVHINPMYINVAIANQTFNFTGKKHTDKMKANQSARFKDKKQSAEFCIKIKAANKNKITIFNTLTQKYERVIMNESLSLLDQSIYKFTGSLRSDSSRRKTSKAIKGRIHIISKIDNTHKFIKSEEFDENIHKLGTSEKHKNSCSTSQAGLLYWTNIKTNEQTKKKICPGPDWVNEKCNFGENGNPFSYLAIGKDIRTNIKASIHKDNPESIFIMVHNKKIIFKIHNNYFKTIDSLLKFISPTNISAGMIKLYNIDNTCKYAKLIEEMNIEIINVKNYIYSQDHKWLH